MAERDPLALSWHERVLERFRLIKEAEEPARLNQKDDYKFSYGDNKNHYQWSEADKALRAGRPMITNNRTDQYCKRLANQILLEQPSGKVSPVDSVDDPELAEDLEGVIRHIQTNSDADIAHNIAVNWQIRGGVGYWRIYPERKRGSLLQDLCVKPIVNRFTVYLDPAAQDPAGADARDGFVTETLDRDVYMERFPKSTLASRLLLGGTGDVPPAWLDGSGFVIAEYWKRVPKATEDGGEDFEVQWAVINGVEILEGNEKKTGPRTYPIPYVPIVRVCGDIFIDPELGETDYRGVVRTARDPQKYANYMDSASAEMVALAPKAPYIGYEGQFENHPEWETANTKNWSKLEAKATVKGVPGLLPLPQRSAVEPPIQAMGFLAQRASNNLRAVLGEVDTDAQERKPEQSGKAILARERQGEIGNAHFRSNLGRGLRHEIRILLAWMPHIYDVARQLRILGNDETEKTVVVYSGAENAPQNLPPDVKAYDLKDLTFDVVINEGPSFQSKRQETFEAISELIKSAPEVMIPLGADLWLESMDVPVGRKLAKRASKQFGHDEDTKPIPMPPEAEKQMQQLGQMNQLLTQELNAKNDVIEQEAQKIESEERRTAAELVSKERIAQLQAQTDVRIAAMKLRAEREIAELKAQYAMREQANDLNSEHQRAQDDRTHEAGLKGQDRSFEAHEAERSRTHQSAEADRGRAHEAQQADADRETQVEMHGMGATDTE